MSDLIEEWRWVPGCEGRYQVSNLGNVRTFLMRFGRSDGKARPKARQVNPSGYYTVGLMIDGQQVTARVHQLVMAAFIGPQPAGQSVRHLDGVRTNNILTNLAYGTLSENAFDSVRHGTHPQVRKTHCPAGHLYDEANTGARRCRGYTYRACRKCHAARARKWKRARREQRLAAMQEPAA